MRVLVFCLAATLAICPLPAASSAREHPEPASIDERAKSILDKAIAAHGGLDRLRALTAIRLKAHGSEHRSAEVQGYKPDERTTAAHQETLVVLPSRNKLAFEHKTARHDGTVRWRRWLYGPDERRVGDFINNATYTRRNISTAADRTGQARRIPHLMLLEAGNTPGNVRFVDASAMYGGRKHDVIGFSPSGEKVELRMYVDSQTHTLSKLEYRMDFPCLGDVAVEYTYGDYRRDPVLGWIPGQHTVKVAGNVYRQIEIDEMAANPEDADAIFQLPEFPAPDMANVFRLPKMPDGANIPEASITNPAPGVHVVAIGPFTVMFVEFKDFVLAVEAPAIHPSLDGIPADAQPGSTLLSETFIGKIKETVPGKPIRYLAVTHFHSDHAGGARAFMAEGAIVLTTPGNRRFFETMAAAGYALIPDRFSKAGLRANIEVFSGKRVISDGTRSVELIDVGPNPHTAENVVVYLPKEKILFQGDLFYFGAGAPFPPKDRITVVPFFAKWLEKRKLAPERIYSVHGDGFATMEHVREVLKIASGSSR